MFKDKKDFIKQYQNHIAKEKGKDLGSCSNYELYMMLASLLSEKARDIRSKDNHRENNKTIYYFSIEFLLGRLLENYLISFNVKDVVRAGLEELKVSLDDLFEEERDAALGNGGLGRLAACFIDSLATLNI